MVITRTYVVATVGVTVITSGLGLLCALRIVEFKTILEIVVSVCAHHGIVFATHSLVKPGAVIPGH